MIVDVIALGILATFALIGLLRGGLASGAGLATLAAGYGAAVVSAQHLGPKVSQQLGLPALAGLAVAGTVAFFVVAIFLGVATAALKRWARERRGDAPRSALDRGLGGMFGALRGVLLVMLLSWLALWIDAARDNGALSGLEAAPETEGSLVARATEAVVEAGLESALSDSGRGGKVMAHLVARPSRALQGFQSLLDDSRIRALQNDRFFWTLVENGAHERAMNRHSFQDVLHDEQLRSQLAELGLITPEAARDPAAFRQAASEAFAELGPRLKSLTDDPDFQRLAADPELAAILQSGDTMGLLKHDGIQKLLTKVSSSL
jgi:membrane protein required for colicin V production